MTYVFTFLILFLFWIILSGMFDSFHLSLGIISCSIVTVMSRDLFFRHKASLRNIKQFIMFARYVPWLLYQILLANIHVAYLVLHPKTLIEPQMIIFKSVLKSDIARVFLANSITLTPGTITLDITDEGEFIVHALSRKTADDLTAGDMEKRIARIFMED